MTEHRAKVKALTQINIAGKIGPKVGSKYIEIEEEHGHANKHHKRDDLHHSNSGVQNHSVFDALANEQEHEPHKGRSNGNGTPASASIS